MIVDNDEEKPLEKYKWVDRGVGECLEEMVQFIHALLGEIDERMECCVTEAAKDLGKYLFIPFLHPLARTIRTIICTEQSQLS